jgi:predicted ArsR family transcriptional regulator
MTTLSIPAAEVDLMVQGYEMLAAVHQVSRQIGHNRARFHATAKLIGEVLDLSEAEARDQLRPLVEDGLVEAYVEKRRFSFTAYRLTIAGESALGLE